MQIKRFEAADMTEALRMVKRDFGDDAVILSAKEIRPGGLFSALKKRHVVITAAMDYQAKTQDDSISFPEHLTEQLDEDTPDDRVSISRKTEPAGGNKNDTGDWKPMHLHQPADTDAPVKTHRSAVASPLSALRRYSHANADLPGNAANDLVTQPLEKALAAPFFRIRSARPPQRIAMVGPSGSGKSTTIAKLARHCQTVEKKKTGLISLDRFRMGANGLLENVARIMNLQVVVIHEPDALASVLEEMVGLDIVLIDTPGVDSTDTAIMQDVGRMLHAARPDETHLVVNATMREKFLLDAIDTFSAFGTNRLLLTHLDAYGGSEHVSQVLSQTSLPASFYGTGVDLFDGLCIAVDHSHASSIPANRRQADDPKTECSPPKASDEDGDRLPIDLNRVKYVANRNSELFHHPSCKSVRRINAENIAAFNSIEQAMEEGFKPCRACCSISSAKKPAFHAFGFQRASAL